MKLCEAVSRIGLISWRLPTDSQCCKTASPLPHHLIFPLTVLYSHFIH